MVTGSEIGASVGKYLLGFILIYSGYRFATRNKERKPNRFFKKIADSLDLREDEPNNS